MKIVLFSSVCILAAVLVVKASESEIRQLFGDRPNRVFAMVELAHVHLVDDVKSWNSSIALFAGNQRFVNVFTERAVRVPDSRRIMLDKIIEEPAALKYLWENGLNQLASSASQNKEVMEHLIHNKDVVKGLVNDDKIIEDLMKNPTIRQMVMSNPKQIIRLIQKNAPELLMYAVILCFFPALFVVIPCAISSVIMWVCCTAPKIQEA